MNPTPALNVAIEKAGRVAEFLEFGELMCLDALERRESLKLSKTAPLSLGSVPMPFSQCGRHQMSEAHSERQVERSHRRLERSISELEGSVPELEGSIS